MRPIVIGAGRGSRLGKNTDAVPKTLVEVMGRPMLDWILEAFAAAGFARKDVVFVCGYAEDAVRRRYPEFTFVRNADWANNNVLLSLFCAREELRDGFIASYGDIVYEPEIVRKLARASGNLVLGCDTAWRRRYLGRSQHPESDAEKLRADGPRVLELGRRIPSEAAQGEFIGVLKASAQGAAELAESFARARAAYAGKTYREGRTFERAYLIDLLAEMLEAGSVLTREDTDGGYMEIDTEQDLASAERWWRERP